MQAGMRLFLNDSVLLPEIKAFLATVGKHLSDAQLVLANGSIVDNVRASLAVVLYISTDGTPISCMLFSPLAM